MTCDGLLKYDRFICLIALLLSLEYKLGTQQVTPESEHTHIQT